MTLFFNLVVGPTQARYKVLKGIGGLLLFQSIHVTFPEAFPVAFPLAFPVAFPLAFSVFTSRFSISFHRAEEKPWQEANGAHS